MIMIRDMSEAAVNATAGTRHILREVFPIPATAQLPEVMRLLDGIDGYLPVHLI